MKKFVEELENLKECPACKGKGKVKDGEETKTCPKCKNSGYVLKKKMKIKEILENEFNGKKDKVVSTEHKVGDEVICDEGGGSSRYGKVHRIGRTMIHVKHNNGNIAAYDPKHVEKYSKTYWQDKQGKK